MRWKMWLIGIVVLALAIPAALYFGSLDWSRSHSAHVSALPLFKAGDERGEFRIGAGGFEFRARVAGMQNEGDGVILLHGFPESSIMWVPLIDALADAGYRVVAFDQRGYSPGARPRDVADYDANLLVDDVLAVAEAVGFNDFHLVGHDWGSAVGWVTVFRHPDRVRSWTAMAIPHLGSFNDAVLNDPDQKERSSYFAVLKKPMVPEFLLTYSGQKQLERLLSPLPEEQRNEYLSIHAEPGALTAALNWYRAMDNERIAASAALEVEVQTPTLFIWGNQDVVVARSSVAGQRRYLKGPFRELELEAGHWLLVEKSEQVIGAVLSHIDAYANRSRDLGHGDMLIDGSGVTR